VVEPHLRDNGDVRLGWYGAVADAAEKRECAMGRSAWAPFVFTSGANVHEGVRWSLGTRDREREGGDEGEGESVRSLLTLAHAVLPPLELSAFLDYLALFASLTASLSEMVESELVLWLDQHMSLQLRDGLPTAGRPTEDPATVAHLTAAHAGMDMEDPTAALVSLLTEVAWPKLHTLKVKVGQLVWPSFFESMAETLDEQSLPSLRVIDAGVTYVSYFSHSPTPLPKPPAGSRTLTLPPADLCLSKLPNLRHVALPEMLPSIDARWLSLSVPDLPHGITIRHGQTEVRRTGENQVDVEDEARLETLMLIGSQNIECVAPILELLPRLRHLFINCRRRPSPPISSFTPFYSSLSHSIAPTLVSLTLTTFTLDSLAWTTPLTSLRRLEIHDGLTPVPPSTETDPVTISLAPLPASLAHLILYVNVAFIDLPLGSVVYEDLPQMLDGLPCLGLIALSPLDSLVAPDAINVLASAVQRSTSLSSFMGRTKRTTGTELVPAFGEGWYNEDVDGDERLLLVRDDTRIVKPTVVQTDGALR
jgi:hypothetical protein